MVQRDSRALQKGLALLRETGLEQLELPVEVTLDQLKEVLKQGRPALLNHLKELGVKWTRNGSATASGNFINNKLSALTIGSLKHPGAEEALIHERTVPPDVVDPGVKRGRLVCDLSKQPL